MWSLCGGREGKEEVKADESGDHEGVFSGSEAYRPNRGLARELIDDQAMAPSAQVEVPAGTPRSNFSVAGARAGAPGTGAGWPGAPGGGPQAPATLSSYNTANAVGFRQAASSGPTSSQPGGMASDADTQGEILGEELKKEGNQLYNEGQLEAAELVYSEALKVRAPLQRRDAAAQRDAPPGLVSAATACIARHRPPLGNGGRSGCRAADAPPPNAARGGRCAANAR